MSCISFKYCLLNDAANYGVSSLKYNQMMMTMTMMMIMPMITVVNTTMTVAMCMIMNVQNICIMFRTIAIVLCIDQDRSRIT